MQEVLLRPTGEERYIAHLQPDRRRTLWLVQIPPPWPVVMSLQGRHQSVGQSDSQSSSQAVSQPVNGMHASFSRQCMHAWTKEWKEQKTK